MSYYYYLRAAGPRLAGLLLALLLALSTAAQAPVTFDEASVPIVPGPGGGSVLNVQYALDGQDNLYVAGSTGGVVQVGSFTLTNTLIPKIFLAKRDVAGVWQWAQLAQTQMVTDLTADTQGNVYLTGYFEDTARFGPFVLYNTQVQQTGSRSAFVAKVSPTGNWEWAEMIGEYSRTRRGLTEGRAIAVDQQGNVAVTGTFESPAVYVGSTLLYNVDSLNIGHSDVFVAKLDANGLWLWAQSMGSTGGGREQFHCARRAGPHLPHRHQLWGHPHRGHAAATQCAVVVLVRGETEPARRLAVGPRLVGTKCSGSVLLLR